MELIELTVTEEFEMARLDQFLAGHLTQSRTYIQKLIKAGQITINGNLITRVKVPSSIMVILPYKYSWSRKTEDSSRRSESGYFIRG